MTTDNVKIEPTSSDLDLAANAVFSNPDSDSVGLPPDGYRGLATVTVQKIQDQIKEASDYDLWIVQYPFEPVGAADPIASYMIGMDTAPTSTPGLMRPAADDPAWGAAGLATTLSVGGLCAYVMNPGQSPFPGPKGPYNPRRTLRLAFGADVLHDSARVIGGFYEAINTTAALYQQGTSFHASLENPTNEKVDIVTSAGVVGAPYPDTFNVFQTNFDQELMPFGDAAEMMKVPNSMTMAAKEGVFAPGRLNMEDNAPTQGLNYACVMIGGSDATTLNFGSRRLVLTVAATQLVTGATANSAVLNVNPTFVIPSTFFRGQIYKSNLSMQVSTFQGLTKESTFTLIRRLATHCLCTTGSKYYSFAKYSGVPPNAIAMAALQAAIDNTPDFYPSSSNANGKAWGKLKGVFNKALKVASPVAALGKSAIGDIVKQQVASVIGATPAGATALSVLKTAKRVQKATSSSAKNNNNNNNNKK